VADAVAPRDAAQRPEADAAVARRAGRVLAVLVADCMPVVLADEEARAVALAHAGWRGLCAGVLEAALESLGAAPGKVLAWLGPAIGPDAYEVGPEVRAAFVARDASAAAAFRPGRGDRFLLDLYAVARQRLAARGVRRVHGGGHCTYAEAERFFSYRRDATRSRMAAFAWLA
jgi:YfiH family protein